MLHGETEVDPKRLLDAADTLLEAEAAKRHGMGLVEVLDHRAATQVPREQFTARELIEAMSFLIRAGLVEPRNDASPRQRRRAGG